MFFIRVKYITQLWVSVIRPAMKLRGGYSSPDCLVNRSHSIKYLRAGQCSSTWIGSRMLCESSRMPLNARPNYASEIDPVPAPEAKPNEMEPSTPLIVVQPTPKTIETAG